MTCRLKKIATVVATLALAAPSLALAGNGPSLNLSQAAGLVAKQQYSEAIELYTAILDGDKPSTEDRGAAYFQRGIAEQEIGMTGHAIADFTQAIWLGHLDNKQLATAHFRRGKGYSLLKQYSRAITDFDRAIQLEPAFAQAYSERADAYRNRGIYKLALQDYSTSIRLLNPELHLPYFGRGLTHEAMGNDRLAAADFRRAAELEPEFSLASARLSDPTGVRLSTANNAEGDTVTSAPEKPAAVDDSSDPASALAIAEDAEGEPQLAGAGQVERQISGHTPPVHVTKVDQPEPMPVERTDTKAVAANSQQTAVNNSDTKEFKHASANDEAAPGVEGEAIKKVAANDATSALPDTASSPVERDNVIEGQTASAESAPGNVAVDLADAEEAATPLVDNEATGAIPEADREISATTIREQQTAEATTQKVEAQSGPVAKLQSAQEETESNQVAALPVEATDGKFLVQIASYREKDDALRRFDTLSSQHGDLLSELSPDILRADLGDRGIYYRLRIGPFQSFEGSTDLCNALKERNLDCLVIQRKDAG